MLIRRDGPILGTVGGGCGEADVLEVARLLLEDDESGNCHRLVRIDLTEEIAEAAQRICGGVMEVLVEKWVGTTPEPAQLYKAANQGVVRVVALQAGDGTATLMMDDGTGASSDEFTDSCEQARANLTSFGDKDQMAFFEWIGSGFQFIIFGAGHIAHPLSQLAKMLDYHVMMIDDRPEFAREESFPYADEVIADRFEAVIDSLEIAPAAVVVLITRGHRQDDTCLRKLIHSPSAYIGMLGSRRRVKAVMDSMLEDGFELGLLRKVRAPIGLNIGSNNPAEIAVSIMSEVVSMRRDGRAHRNASLKLMSAHE